MAPTAPRSRLPFGKVDFGDGGRRRLLEEKLAALRAGRDNSVVRKSLDALKRAAGGTEDSMPRILDAARAYATLGETCDALRGVFGAYQEKTHI